MHSRYVRQPLKECSAANVGRQSILCMASIEQWVTMSVSQLMYWPPLPGLH